MSTGETQRAVSSAEGETTSPVEQAAWTTYQAAKRLGLPYRTLMSLIHDGRLAYVRVGRYYVVPETAIQDFLATAQVAS